MRAELHRSAEPPLPMGVVVRRLGPTINRSNRGDPGPGTPPACVRFVSPEWRNRGVGTALVIRSGNRLSAMGATEWTLAVTVGNPAQRLYERVGFRVDRGLPRKR